MRLSVPGVPSDSLPDSLGLRTPSRANCTCKLWSSGDDVEAQILSATSCEHSSATARHADGANAAAHLRECAAASTSVALGSEQSGISALGWDGCAWLGRTFLRFNRSKPSRTTNKLQPKSTNNSLLRPAQSHAHPLNPRRRASVADAQVEEARGLCARAQVHSHVREENAQRACSLDQGSGLHGTQRRKNTQCG